MSRFSDKSEEHVLQGDIAIPDEALLSGEVLVDEKVFLIVAHRVAELQGLDAPTVPLELVLHNPTEILFVYGIVSF